MGLFDMFKKKSKSKVSNSTKKKLAAIDKDLDDVIASAPNDEEKDALRSLELLLKTMENDDALNQEEKNWLEAYDMKQKEKEIKEKEIKEKELDEKIAKGELWLGMTTQQLVLMKGEPEKKTETISRNKTRNEYYYDGTKNNRGNMSYKLKVVLIEGKVEKWTIT